MEKIPAPAIGEIWRRGVECVRMILLICAIQKELQDKKKRCFCSQQMLNKYRFLV
jgi:hypothetical protein